MKAARQHVQEKAADELVGRERHGLEPLASLDAVVLPLEGDALVVELDEARIRDRDTMGLARQVGDDGLRTSERPLGVDHPFGSAQRRERGVEGALVGERGKVAEESEAAGRMQGCEAFEEEPAEEARPRAPAGRSRACRRSSANRPAKRRRRER